MYSDFILLYNINFNTLIISYLISNPLSLTILFLHLPLLSHYILPIFLSNWLTDDWPIRQSPRTHRYTPYNYTFTSHFATCIPFFRRLIIFFDPFPSFFSPKIWISQKYSLYLPRQKVKLIEQQMKSRAEYIDLIRSRSEVLQSQFGVTSMRLFGSVARNQHSENSDVYILDEYMIEVASSVGQSVQKYNKVAAYLTQRQLTQ